MSGLNVLLWTLAIMLMSVFVLGIVFLIYAFAVRKKQIKEFYQKQKKSVVSKKIEDINLKQEDLLIFQQNINKPKNTNYN